MKSVSTAFKILRNVIVPAVALSSALAFTPAQAAKFGVRVVDAQGQPIAGAAVCIGLQGNYKQFGALFTDASGNAMVDVPNVPLLVTVSKDRFTGTRTTEPARSFNLLKQVKLLEGVPGPRCKAGSALVSNSSSEERSSIKVKTIAIKSGPYSTTLEPVVTGEPSHYRVSDNREFSESKWQRFDNKIALNNGLSDKDKVFVQLRKLVGTGKNWLEARSDVVTVRLVN